MKLTRIVLFQVLFLSLFVGNFAFGAAAKDIKKGAEGVQYLKYIITVARNEAGEWEILLALPRNGVEYNVFSLSQIPNENINVTYERALKEATYGLIEPPKIIGDVPKNYGVVIVPKVSDQELNKAAQKAENAPYTQFNWVSFEQLSKIDAHKAILGKYPIAADLLEAIKTKKGLIPILEKKIKETKDKAVQAKQPLTAAAINPRAEGEPETATLALFVNNVVRQNCKKFIDELNAKAPFHLPDIVLSNQFLAHQMIQESIELRNAQGNLALIKLGIVDRNKKVDPNAKPQEFVKPNDMAQDQYEKILKTLIPLAYGVALKHCAFFLDTLESHDDPLILQMVAEYKILADEIVHAIKTHNPSLLDEFLRLTKVSAAQEG